MNCPSCRQAMDRLEFRSIEVDQCRVCRGVWLDHGEIDQLFALKKLPERLMNHELYREIELKVPEGHRTCPRCNDFLLLIEVDGIKLDACSQCKGFFCDLGEFARLEEAAARRYRQQSQPPES
jgi:Zn-finger nucleic acid-binding protein